MPVLNRAMKKMKYFLIMILVAIVSTSCVEDEFGNVAGTWLESSRSNGLVLKRPPEDPTSTCEKHLIITFNKTLIGHLDKDNYCGSDYELAGFQYNVKEGELTIAFDDQSTKNNLDIISGVNTYVISGNKLTITGEDGTITVLTKE